MIAIAQAQPTPLPTPGLPLPPSTGLLLAPAQPTPATAAGLTLLEATCVAQTTELLRAACQRGQLEDASAAARVALPLSVAKSPHRALLRALAETQPRLMALPDENRLYLRRGPDGVALGLLRLRDNGRIGLSPPADAVRWSMQDGQLQLAADDGQPSARFMLCGEHNGHRLYLGQAVGDGAPQVLQEMRCTYSRLSALDPELAGPFFSLYSVDAMVPASLPARPVLLLGAAHSGSTALAAALNRCDAVAIDGELLQPLALGVESGTLAQARSKDPIWFVQMMMSRSHDGQGRDLAALPVRGFTLVPTQSAPVLDWAIAEPALRIVHWVRSNLLAEFADLLADGQAPTVNAGAATGKLHFEPERFTRFVDMKQRYLANLRQRLVQRSGDTVELDASRLTAASVAELLAFLTDGPTPAPGVALTLAAAQRCALPGLAAGPVIERFANPQAVTACLAALGRPGWADAEGR